MDNYFSALNNINVNDKTEKKNGLTYLSWAWAWAEVKKLFPDAFYTIYENADGWNYHTDGRTCWVKTGCTVNGLEHIEYLPVMDFKNKSIPLDAVTSFDVNKAIQRSLTKALARHGLGLYIYAGEDLPEEERGNAEKGNAGNDSSPPIIEGKAAEDWLAARRATPVDTDLSGVRCEKCNAEIVPYPGADGKTVSVKKHVAGSQEKFNRTLCVECIKKL